MDEQERLQNHMMIARLTLMVEHHSGRGPLPSMPLKDVTAWYETWRPVLLANVGLVAQNFVEMIQVAQAEIEERKH